MALRNLLVRVGADVSGLSAGLKKAQKDVKYFGRNVTGSLKEIQGKMAGLGRRFRWWHVIRIRLSKTL